MTSQNRGQRTAVSTVCHSAFMINTSGANETPRPDEQPIDDDLDATIDADAPATEDEKLQVRAEREKLQKFVKGLTMDDIKGGGWFAKLLTFSMAKYHEQVNAAYFQRKYPGVPVDAIVAQRIKLAARYAMIEGGLSASAYTGAVAATIGSGGGASPATVPLAAGTIMVDVTYLSQLQLRLAYDISVLYGLELNLNDSEDLWKLIKVAFTIKGGELVNEGLLKAAPAMMRPILQRYFSGPVLQAAKGLPFVGKYILKRSVIKIAIPAVGIPLSMALNTWTTVVAGKHARSVFRTEARIIEKSERLVRRSNHPELLLWVAWLVINADNKISESETILFRHLTRLVHEQHGVTVEDLTRVVELDPEDVWERIAASDGDLDDVVAASEVVAAIDGPVNAKERKVLDKVRERCTSRAA